MKELIREFSSDSLLDLHPPKIFQIDGNFGGISGILEMLVRVSGERVKLLPALIMYTKSIRIQWQINPHR